MKQQRHTMSNSGFFSQPHDVYQYKKFIIKCLTQKQLLYYFLIQRSSITDRQTRSDDNLVKILSQLFYIVMLNQIQKAFNF